MWGTLSHRAGQAFGAASAQAELAFGNLDAKLCHANSEIRMLALDTLSRLSRSALEPMIPAVAHAMSDNDLCVRKAAVKALASLAPEEERLAAACTDYDSVGRLAPAMQRLGMLDKADLERHGLLPNAFTGDIISAVCLLLNRDNLEGRTAVRVAAMQSIGKLESSALAQHVMLLGWLLKDPDAHVRRSAADAISHLPVSQIAWFRDSVIEALTDSDFHVRCACIKVLGAVAKSAQSQLLPALPALIGRLGDPDKHVRLAAKQVLMRLDGRTLTAYTTELVGILICDSSPARLGVLEVLNRVEVSTLMQHTNAIAIVASLDSNPLVRSQAAATLGRRPEAHELL